MSLFCCALGERGFRLDKFASKPLASGQTLPEAFMKIRHLSLALLMAVAALCWEHTRLPAQALDLDSVEREIHRLTNQLRQTQQVPPLAPLPGLYHIARKHSQAMATQGFFSHTDPQGRGPSDRMRLFLPGLLSTGSGENIAMRSQGDEGEMALALALFTQWKNSPGHYANMVSGSFRHLGVGVALHNQEIYATQNFAKGLVQLLSGPPAKVKSGPAVKMKFEFLADFPRQALSVFVYVPDKTARFYTSGGSFYTGGGPLEPKWLNQSQFEITVPTDKGLGAYRLGIGQNGSYYNTPFGCEVVSQLSDSNNSAEQRPDPVLAP